jgi:hypothetical protein
LPDVKKLLQRDQLIEKGCDVFDTERLAEILPGHDALISAFNPGWKNPHLYDDQIKGTTSILAALEKAGIRRVLWVGGAGGLEVSPGVRVIDDPSFPKWVKPGSLATTNAFEQLRRHTERDWSFLAPSAQLTQGTRTGKFRLGEDNLIIDANGESKISVADFAVAMIDELERPSHVKRRFTVGY